jgi:DNA-binding GntR family transcriptional regulator
MTSVSAAPDARLRRRSSGEQVAAYLRDEIMAGRLAPGDRINQEETAARLGVSRVPVREALAILENEGRIEIELHRGAHVLPIDPDSVRENTEIFGLIYAHVAGKAAERLTDELDAALSRISDELTAASSGDEVWRIVGTYVDAIMEVGVSKRMNRTLRRMRVLVEVSDVDAVSPEAVQTTKTGLIKTISYIRARDGERASQSQINTQRAAAEHLMAALESRQT